MVSAEALCSATILILSGFGFPFAGSCSGTVSRELDSQQVHCLGGRTSVGKKVGFLFLLTTGFTVYVDVGYSLGQDGWIW